MKPIEISDDLFCSWDNFCNAAISNSCDELSCGECHRKWPTPEQYLKEYGEKYPDEGAVYYLHEYDGWDTGTYDEIQRIQSVDGKDVIKAIVCACTPWGCPPEEWRP